jgi:hypothetical protein
MATSGRTGRTEREVETQPSASRSTQAHGLSVAKPLAPEDVRRGDYVAVLDEMYEIPSYCWCEDAALHPRDELVRIRLIPAQDAPPHKVKSVCLPFVLAKQPTGERRTFDLRRTRLARLDRHYGRSAWRAYKKKQPSKVGSAPAGS